jgi:hypothetical protein
MRCSAAVVDVAGRDSPPVWCKLLRRSDAGLVYTPLYSLGVWWRSTLCTTGSLLWWCLCGDRSLDEVWDQPTKVLTKGGDLRWAQVDVPWSVQPFLRFTALLDSITDSLFWTGDFAYSNKFKVSIKSAPGTPKATALRAYSFSKWGEYFGWMALWDLNPDWHFHK